MKTFKYGALGILGLVGVSAAFFLLRLVLLPVGVAHTAVSSAQGVVARTLDSGNVIANYEWFFDTQGQFEARTAQIRAQQGLIAEESDKQERSRLGMELGAMRQSCRDLAVRYNANSEKANRSLFKSKNLPEFLPQQQCEQ